MIDLGWLGHIAFTGEFLVAVGTIIMIDLVLAGDNAVVIAMSCKNLQGRERKLGILLGAGGAVVIRVICTFMVAKLLTMPFIKLIGGAAIIWIAIKLLTEGTRQEDREHECRGLWQALGLIIVADLGMGIDNMLAVGAASHGNLILLLFGLALSIPFVVFMSGMLSKLIDKYTIILWIGAAILGKVGGEMMVTDPWIQNVLNPPQLVEYGMIAVALAFIFGVSKRIIRRQKTALSGERPLPIEQVL